MEIIKIVQDGIELDVIGSVDASSITQDADNRFVTDSEKTTWNNKQDKLTAGTNVNIKGTTISATDTIYDDTALKDRITAVEEREDKDTITTVNGKTGAITKDDIVALGIPGQDTNTTYDVATTSKNGLMSSSDKTKLNGVETGAEKNVALTVQAITDLGFKQQIILDNEEAYEALSPEQKADATKLYFIKG